MTILSSPPPVTDLLAPSSRPSPAAYLHGVAHRLGRLVLTLAGVVVN